MTFYLGTHQAYWLKLLKFPLFISRRRLFMNNRLPKKSLIINRNIVCENWALDSGGFTELSMYGKWTIDAQQYIQELDWILDNMGKIDFAAQQDWMCEPFIINKTGLSVKLHQEKTIDNFLELMSLNKKSHNIIPVLQGFKLEEYLEHIQMFLNKGIDLTKFETVGVGSVCRRQNTGEFVEIIQTLFNQGIKVHAFGAKITGLGRVGCLLKSADSASWSLAGRREQVLEGCTHKNCGNCIKFACKYRKKILEAIKESYEKNLFVRSD